MMIYPISAIRHPEYNYDYSKWRAAYEGGSSFLDTYLINNTRRESIEDFNLRRKITYVPAFAKSAINDIVNSIYQIGPVLFYIQVYCQEYIGCLHKQTFVQKRLAIKKQPLKLKLTFSFWYVFGYCVVSNYRANLYFSIYN